MGGINSGGHNKKSIEQHISEGTYRKCRYTPIESYKCRYCGKQIIGRKRQFCDKTCQREWYRTNRKPCRRTIHNLVCEGCGVTYQNIDPKHQFCSAKCANKYHGDNRKRHYKCNNCGMVFIPSQSSYKTFCSRDCFFTHLKKRSEVTKQRKKQERELRRTHTCKICGKQYKGQSSSYCSDECRKEVARQKQREREQLVHPPKIIRCIECGQEFKVEYPDKRRLFCSPRCNDRHVQRLHPEIKRDQNHRRRIAKRGLVSEKVKSLQVYERDRWICGICHKRVNSKLSFPHPMSASLDHILPLSHGGHHTYVNCQLAHFICNSLKSDIGSSQLKLFG